MFRRKYLVIATLAALLTVAGACTSDTLDNGGGADVIMEILVLDNPPVTATLDEATQVCTFTIEDWNVDIANEPKNALALAPFNDLVLIRVVINYTWLSGPGGGLSTPQRIVGLGGVTIPAATSGQVTFSPIAFDDLSLANAGRTANLILTFEARTVEGTPVSRTVLRQLNVEACAA